MRDFEDLSDDEIENAIEDEFCHVLSKIEGILELAYRGLDTDKALTRIQGFIEEDAAETAPATRKIH